jgi:hypothetical protein
LAGLGSCSILRLDSIVSKRCSTKDKPSREIEQKRLSDSHLTELMMESLFGQRQWYQYPMGGRRDMARVCEGVGRSLKKVMYDMDMTHGVKKRVWEM